MEYQEVIHKKALAGLPIIATMIEQDELHNPFIAMQHVNRWMEEGHAIWVSEYLLSTTRLHLGGQDLDAHAGRTRTLLEPALSPGRSLPARLGPAALGEITTAATHIEGGHPHDHQTEI